MDKKVLIDIDTTSGQITFDGTLFVGETVDIEFAGVEQTPLLVILAPDGKTNLADNSTDQNVLDLRGSVLRNSFTANGTKSFRVIALGDDDDVLASGIVPIRWSPIVFGADHNPSTLKGEKGDKGDKGDVGPLGPLTQIKDPDTGKWYNVYARLNEDGERVLSVEQEESEPSDGGVVAMKRDVAAEATARAAAVAAEKSARESAVSSEATARDAAIAAAVAAEKSARETAVSAEATAREAAIAAEATARAAAINPKANDSEVVKLAGNQTISGVKTFSGNIVAGAGLSYKGASIENFPFVGNISGYGYFQLTTTQTDFQLSDIGFGIISGKAYDILVVFSSTNASGKLKIGTDSGDIEVSPPLASNICVHKTAMLADEEGNIKLKLSTSSTSYIRSVLVLAFKAKEA